MPTVLFQQENISEFSLKNSEKILNRFSQKETNLSDDTFVVARSFLSRLDAHVDLISPPPRLCNIRVTRRRFSSALTRESLYFLSSSPRTFRVRAALSRETACTKDAWKFELRVQNCGLHARCSRRVDSQDGVCRFTSNIVTLSGVHVGVRKKHSREDGRNLGYVVPSTYRSATRANAKRRNVADLCRSLTQENYNSRSE